MCVCVCKLVKGRKGARRIIAAEKTSETSFNPGKGYVRFFHIHALEKSFKPLFFCHLSVTFLGKASKTILNSFWRFT